MYTHTHTHTYIYIYIYIYVIGTGKLVPVIQYNFLSFLLSNLKFERIEYKIYIFHPFSAP